MKTGAVSNLFGFSADTFENLQYLLFMPSNFSFFSRRVPDNVTEELVAALSGSKTYEFKALFSVIHAVPRGPWAD